MDSSYFDLKHRNVLEIVHDSFKDLPTAITTPKKKSANDSGEIGIMNHEVRYKLIIDSSEDDSAIRLLFAYGILDKQNCRMFVCSEFPEESKMHVSLLKLLKLYHNYSIISDQHNSWHKTCS